MVSVLSLLFLFFSVMVVLPYGLPFLKGNGAGGTIWFRLQSIEFERGHSRTATNAQRER
jgi:hypothetical protein